ncbi:short-chain dehydrogenase reductase sdr [Moniliophthora roreri MCA 2997]|uniref:Short-chain dehydrogenase reductase sdr n=1 Tax=Moniliophthora roreri (strain MCA 2997) TaxID=1381753 RepID=V2Y5L3_MONRO|nr:short-chain dehydrogenase reductase sdr [Moniliophthora roreri MCA 2997]KAI3607368.1 short-chain dehydrogenase reductase sdr [Moniliophthora roreri]
MSRQNVWLITGTSTGFGRRIVLLALERGDLVIASARNLAKLQDLPTSENLRILHLDLSWNSAKIKAAVDEALTFWGRIDVLVNNAGYALKIMIEDASIEDFKEQFQTNFFGTVDVTNAVLPSMRKRRSGTIVNIGSRTTWGPEYPSQALYASSKAALRCYTENLNHEVSPFSIRVMICEPGSARTEGIMGAAFRTDYPIPDYDEIRQWCAQRYRSLEGKQRGDPDKMMRLLVDVVRGEGQAAGREFPLYLPLGQDVEDAITRKSERMLDVVNKWKDLTSNMNF